VGDAAAPEPAIVARVGETAIAAEELDAPLRLRLYDLEEAKHRLRRERLDHLVADRLVDVGDATPEQVGAAVSAGEVEILLEAPERPRIDVEPGDLPRRGTQDAPVLLVVFCDFASRHCARVQPTLRRLLRDYEGLVAVAHRDHPLSFHRHGHAAAEAARCAGEEDGAYWRYHDALYADPERLDRDRLESLARTLELDTRRFRSCLETRRMRSRVEADLRAARALGLRNAPVTFVNGLYLKGPAPEEDFRALVDAELSVRGIAPPAIVRPASAERSEIPLLLVGTVVDADPQRSLAAFESETWRATRSFRPGEEVLEGVTLARVESRRVLVRRADGTTEMLSLAARAAPDGQEASALESRESEGVLHLSREAVDRALEDREALEERLAPGRLDVEGHHLLKLQEIEPGSLYEALGLLPGDVVMQVDGVFVHDGYNPLWETLRTRSQLTVTVMRGGFPKTFSYAID
jgi:protein-disulfide isomerase/type II secretory pathway component PulC